jgi:hypothetical protein
MFLLPVSLWLGAPFAAPPVESTERARDWVSLDAYHQSRSLPAFDTIVQSSINPGVQARLHHAWFGKSVTGGSTANLAFVTFDRLFWSVALGTGFEGVWRTQTGFYTALGLHLDYARAFTGRNNFEFDGERYRQETDHGRGFLRVTLADLAFGYSPEALRRLGFVPALRYAWAVELPLYENEDANPWSYTAFGLSVFWTWERGAK